MARQSWISFPTNNRHFGDQVEFCDDGTVRLGGSIYADGYGIDCQFGGNTATRKNEFGAVLTIKSTNNDAYHFRFDGEQWLRRIEAHGHSSSFLYSLRQEMAHSGVILGGLYWIASSLGTLCIFSVTLLFALAVNGAAAVFWYVDHPAKLVPLLGAAYIDYHLIVGLRTYVRNRRINRYRPITRWEEN